MDDTYSDNDYFAVCWGSSWWVNFKVNCFWFVVGYCQCWCLSSWATRSNIITCSDIWNTLMCLTVSEIIRIRRSVGPIGWLNIRTLHKPLHISVSSNYNTADATTFSVAANTTFVYTAGAVTYGVNQDAYMFWRIQKSYTENPTWDTQAYPYQYLSSPTSGLSYHHDCDINVDPYNSSSYQYETRPSNEQNSCVDNKQWRLACCSWDCRKHLCWVLRQFLMG